MRAAISSIASKYPLLLSSRAPDYYLSKADVAYGEKLRGKKLKDLVRPDVPIIQTIESSRKNLGSEMFDKGCVAKLVMSDLTGKSLILLFLRLRLTSCGQ